MSLVCALSIPSHLPFQENCEVTREKPWYLYFDFVLFFKAQCLFLLFSFYHRFWSNLR